jgi:hypothetical protein
MSTDSAAADPAPPERKTFLDKIGPAFAIGMTALSAVFGSMSASQLQQSMYYKSQAAQDQSKSANQWGFFGFKRSRGLQEELAAHESRSASGYLRYQFPVDPNAPELAAEAAKWLNGDGPPNVKLPAIEDATLDQLINDIKARKPEPELQEKAATIPLEHISKAIEDLESFAFKTTEVDWDKVIKAAKAMAKKVVDEADRKPEDKIDQTKKDRADAVQRLVYSMEDRRYRGEGFINQSIGYLYDTRVLWSAAKSDYYKHRSLLLGYAMLVAQIGAVTASLALARKGGFLWLFVAIIGIVAVGFGGFAYLAPGMIRF